MKPVSTLSDSRPDGSIPYEQMGRRDQKQRTREALIRAARDMVTAGQSPTVEQAAEHAGVSRATAYRYFANQHQLLAAAHPETAADSLLPPDPPTDPAARLTLVVEAFTDLIVRTQPQQRTMLRLSLEAEPAQRNGLPLRQGRAIGWIDEALAPLRNRMSDDQLHRLVLAIRSAIGIEALVWLTDVAALTTEDAVELMRWSAQGLLTAALSEPPAGPGLNRASSRD